MISERMPAHSELPAVRTVPYDLIREIAIALVVSLVLILGLAIFLLSLIHI